MKYSFQGFKLLFLFITTLILIFNSCTNRKSLKNKVTKFTSKEIIKDTLAIENVELKIGKQFWMIRNLNVDTFCNGDKIPEVTDLIEWGKLTTPAWCNLDNLKDNGDCYGKLYNWYAVNDSRGLAPKGYHIPSLDEWRELIKCLGGTKNTNKNLRSTYGWVSDKSFNVNGFSAIPGSYRSIDGEFFCAGYFAGWWTSTENGTKAFVVGLGWDRNFVEEKKLQKQYGVSLRCIRN
jgi:hypothetical protein